jgi:hypothetical protein
MSSLRRKATLSRPSPAHQTAARTYDRLSQLPGLIGLWPSEMQDYSAAGTSKILALLRKALRSERLRGGSGHWTYDLNRHLALAESLKAERAHLRELDQAPVAPQRAASRKATQRAGKILHLPQLAAEDRRGDMVQLEIFLALPRPDQPVFLLPILAESNS